MSDEEGAASVLQRRLAELAEGWRQRFPDTGSAEQAITRSQAAAVLAVVAAAIDHGSLPSHLADSLFRHEPDLDLRVPHVAALRDLLHRALLAEMNLEDAVDALERLNHVLDDLLTVATDRALRNLEGAAFIDPLTGAGNRRALARDGRRELAGADRHGRIVALVSLDVDGLKVVNDTEGHAAGDATLRSLTEALISQLRAGDGLYRVGGDEFVAVLPDTDQAGAAALLDRVRPLAPAFTAGIVTAPADGTGLDELLAISDARLLDIRRQRREGAETRARRRRPDATKALAVVVPGAAILAAEGLRQAAAIPLEGDRIAAWGALLTGGAVVGSAASRRLRFAHLSPALSSAAVGVPLLGLLLATLVPLSVDPDHGFLPETGDVFAAPPLSTTPTAIGPTPTTTTIVVPLPEGGEGEVVVSTDVVASRSGPTSRTLSVTPIVATTPPTTPPTTVVAPVSPPTTTVPLPTVRRPVTGTTPASDDRDDRDDDTSGGLEPADDGDVSGGPVVTGDGGKGKGRDKGRDKVTEKDCHTRSANGAQHRSDRAHGSGSSHGRAPDCVPPSSPPGPSQRSGRG